MGSTCCRHIQEILTVLSWLHSSKPIMEILVMTGFGYDLFLAGLLTSLLLSLECCSPGSYTG
jgi:hypothetical protein